jgi:hypothetical protein
VKRRLTLAVIATSLLCQACTTGGQEPTTSGATPTEASTPIVVTTADPNFQPVQGVLLPPGTYASDEFMPTLTYTVPEGWVVFDDVPGQFELALENQDPYIYVWRDVRVIASDCTEGPEPGIGSSAADIAGALATRDGLIESQPEPVAIGGLEGFAIDARMSPDWAEACPFSDGEPTVPTIIGTEPLTGFVLWGTLTDSSQRYYFLDLGNDTAEGNIAIAVEVCCGADFDEVMAAVEPLIDSFVFAP